MVQRCVFVPHGYGVTKEGELPLAEQAVIQAAGRATTNRVGQVYFVVGSWSAPESRVQDKEHAEKLRCLSKVTLPTEVHVLRNRAVDNTADEIVAWTDLLKKEGLFTSDNEIIIFHARFHWGLRWLWKRHLKKNGITIPVSFVSVDREGMWNSTMPSGWQQNTFMWCVAGIIRMGVYAIWGTKTPSIFNHKYKKEARP